MRKLPVNLSSVTTVGLDLAKHVFFIHAVDAQGQVVFAKEVRRRDLLSFFASLPPCLVGVEACSSAHHWARELTALAHDVRLIPPAYVKPYVKRQKNDAADAAAICEAVTRPSMRFVKVRSIDNQAVLMHHKVREMLVRQRTQILNGLRGHLAEIGIIAAQGPVNARALADLLRRTDASIAPAVATALLPLVTQLEHLDAEIKEADAAIARLAKADPVASALMSIPGIGPVGLGAGCQRGRSIRLLGTTAVRRVPGPGSTAELVGRQTPARAYLEDGQCLSQKAAGRGRARRALSSRAAC